MGTQEPTDSWAGGFGSLGAQGSFGFGASNNAFGDMTGSWSGGLSVSDAVDQAAADALSAQTGGPQVGNAEMDAAAQAEADKVRHPLPLPVVTPDPGFEAPTTDRSVTSEPLG